MECVQESSHDMRVFAYIRDFALGALRRVDIVHGRISVQEGKNGDFLMWQGCHNGGERRFPKDTQLWTTRDVEKFNRILESRSTFYVLIRDEDVQVFRP